MATKVTSHVNKGDIAPIEDARKRVCITVSKFDAKRAKRFCPDECVLARATTRAFPDAQRAFFYKGSAYISFADKNGKPTRTLRYQPSKNAALSIVSFDNGKGFRPGKYWLEVPKGSNKLDQIKIRGEKRPGRHKPTGKGAPRRPLKEVQPPKMTRLQYYAK